MVKIEAANTYAALSGAQSVSLLKSRLAINGQSLFQQACLKNIAEYEPQFAAEQVFAMLRKSSGKQEEVKNPATMAKDSNTLNHLADVVTKSHLSREEAQIILREAKYSG